MAPEVDSTKADSEKVDEEKTVPAAPHTAEELTGTPVVAGIVSAPVVVLGPRPLAPAGLPRIGESGRDAETERFRSAAATVAERLRGRAAHASGAAAEVLQANAAMAADRGWLSAAEKLIAAGAPAGEAAAAATEQFVEMFTRIGGMMAERVTDLRDIRDRVLAELAGDPEPGVPEPDVPSILCARDLAPADTAGLDPGRIVGLVTELGGPTSHTAIIARQLGISCVVAAAGVAAVPAGTSAMLDGSRGVLVVDPDPDVAAAAVAADVEARRRIGNWTGPGRTSDGVGVAILANVQDGAGARAARRTPAEGVGLLRTELAFLDRTVEPSVEEQSDIYAEVLEAFAGDKVVIRTLDAGSDKPLAFADHPDEANPALGVRGVRIARADPGLLTRQLDAVAVAAQRTRTSPWVMAPMIATAAEAEEFAGLVRERGLVPGVMVEIPAAALQADRILEHVDFLSIGTNDLTQYTMAADRMSPELAVLTDPWQPAVLSLVARTAEAGAAVGKPVGVCGEAAADPLLACVLVGLGVTSLSAAAAALPAVGAAVESVSARQCRSAAEAVLATTDPAAARAAAAEVLT
ncbi:phosphoenolpyruvate--protein phosphotransferase [Rhodococcus triatomae]|uniref:Phosphoenolpyruvate-protein phosphotransferase n=1 Tax=Rhodococcus triatomae TaxID=300028 RepID=A0A1G8MUQ8_9NOCA|nr:putative PEP-binding protein [Rhodococcus triatomae]QNG19100.1 phosphoenolpyruvate--protein phosphotransferase [Rhodococcus triatomae]QNG24987.1 phosphoenolpyruvate--protein phosphotransferase [Rhodococcus triatomae]SDI71758.1 phosphotransferase system, enzyme I, PtsI [Rhodococcus triatomae]